MKCKALKIGFAAVMALVPAFSSQAETEMLNGVMWGYTVSNNASIVTNANPANGTLTVPNTLGGYPVTSIKEKAFEKCYQLTSLIIGDNVEDIGAYAFYDCRNLKSVTIPENVTRIGTNAFNSCDNLVAVYIQDLTAWCDITFEGWISNPLYYADHFYLNGVEVQGTLVIPSETTRIGDRAFHGYSNLTSVTVGSNVTHIGEQAFYGCCGLTNVTIPESVKTMGIQAFYGCNSLKVVNIHNLAAWCEIVGDEGNTGGSPMYYAHHLHLNGQEVQGALVIPNDAKRVGSEAFYGCTNLTSVTIGGNVTNIGVRAFSQCSGLTNVVIPNVVMRIGDYGFSSCFNLAHLEIPASITEIGNGAFEGCSKLFDTSSLPGVTLVDGWAIKGTNSLSGNLDLSDIRGIGGRAFNGCTGLTNVVLPDGITCIGAATFHECTRLTSVTIPDGVTRIGAGAFRNCYQLTSVRLPDSVKSIGGWAFDWCSGLTSVNIPDGVTAIEMYAFEGCSGLTKLELPESVTNIGLSAFASCRNLASLSLGNRVADIGNCAFSSCESLSGMDLPFGVTNIGYQAFSDCTGLRSVTIPPSVQSIGNAGFSNCCSLVSLTIPNSVTELGKGAFASCRGLKEIFAPPSWRGTSMLADADIPEGCVIRYWDESDVEAPEEQTPNPSIAITPVTRNFDTGGGGGGIVVSGSGTWEARASAAWITLNTTNGAAGYPVAYTVDATTNVESRTGYVYVSGHVHTVTQNGLGGSISPTNATFEHEGGLDTIAVTVPDRMGWRARPNCGWVDVFPLSGTGTGSVTFRVLPFDEVGTRQGTLTVAGQTFTVFQYGRRMKLSPTGAQYDYLTHVIPITVDALPITEWSVVPQNSWISVVDRGSGKGSDLVTIAIGENPSWKARTGTVRIGTETFTVKQKGRTALEFDVSPATTTASVEGANGLIAVTATPDLPWSAESKANWLTVYPATATGAGNGNVAYVSAPNPTLFERTGKIILTPRDTRVSAKTHTVTQPEAIAALSSGGYEFEAAGESCEVRVSLADIVQWQIWNTNEWLTVVGTTNRVGPGTVTLQAAPNKTVYPKNGTVTIAKKTFQVRQKARGVEVEYDTKLFPTDGGSDSISIHPDGQVSWTAVASDKTWITIFQGDSGVGDGEILYIVSPYVGTGEARMGTITVGDKVVWITQRAYDLSIDPAGAVVHGNNGAGEFGVSAGIADVWRAIVTEPWITLIDGYEEGTGNGTVRFVYTDNDTGKTRVGKIIVAGEVYTLEQRAREFVAVSAEAGHGGKVEGAGTYDLGTQVTLTAVPDSGYAFSYWTGAVESMENPLRVVADVPKSYTAVFAPLPVEFTSVTSGTNGVTLAWNPLAWATTWRIFRGVTSVPSSAEVVAELPNSGVCEWQDETGELEVEYWYWVEAEGIEDCVTSDPMTGKKVKPAFPDVEDEAGMVAVLVEATDGRLVDRIESVEEYEAFRAWIAEKKLDATEVKVSTQAWSSYLLGAERLLKGEPEIRLGGFEVGRGGVKAVGGATMRVSVTVRDGGKGVAVDADKVAALFECTSDVSDWTGAAALEVTVTKSDTDGDTIWFEVMPGDGTAERAFLRMADEWERPEARYLVVDLSGGPEAESWPVKYLNVEPKGGFNTDEYKTTKLVLKRIEAGTFTMGHEDILDNQPHQVTLTKPYYIGLFEVTQMQYELVTGDNPSKQKGEKWPVDWVSWDDIRGESGIYNWPNNMAIFEDSFMGRLRARTGLEFDLPTEAQWEYACRAGTRTVYSYGDSVDGDYMWYWSNSFSHASDVGMKQPNPWGLYDMHGNVWEWCLDWYGSLADGKVDPVGSFLGASRVARGGAWVCSNVEYCTASFRFDGDVAAEPWVKAGALGFRLVSALLE